MSDKGSRDRCGKRVLYELPIQDATTAGEWFWVGVCYKHADPEERAIADGGSDE